MKVTSLIVLAQALLVQFQILNASKAIVILAKYNFKFNYSNGGGQLI